MNNFKCDDRVVIVRIPEMSGKTGMVIGKSFDEIITCYIILLDTPGKWKALAIPENCLELEKDSSIDQFIKKMEKF